MEINKPAGVVLQLTKKCNYRCRHCSQNSFWENDQNEELNTENWKQIIDKVKSTGSEGVLFSGGEVFLRSDIRKLSEYAKKIGLNVDYITNGSLLEENKSWIKTINPDSIRISIYSIHKDNYEAISGIKNSFINVLQTIKNMMKENFNIIIYFVLTNYNYTEIDKLVHELYKYNIKKFRFLQLAPTGRAKSIVDNSICLENFIQFWDDATDLKHELKDIDIKIALTPKLFNYVNEKTKIKKQTFTCKLGIENNWFINFKGEMFTCCILANDSKLKIFNTLSTDFNDWAKWKNNKVRNLYINQNYNTACEYLNDVIKVNANKNICQLSFVNL